MYDMNQPGYSNAGGWRYPGRKSSTEAFYQPQPYNLAQLLAVSAKPSQGLLDKAINDPALQAQGLLSGVPYSGNDGRGEEGSPGSPNDPDHMSLGINGMGFGIDSNAAAKGAAKGAMAGPLGMGIGGLLGGAYSDPLGSFAQQAINAQEARDLSWASTPAVSAPSSDVAAGGGWGSLSPETQAAVSVADDPIGAFADAIGMGADAGYSGDLGYGGDRGNTDDGAGGYGGNDNGYALGGLVTPDRLHGMNPAGPDDGFAALDKGEFVITSEMVKKHGKKALKALNEGRATITMNKGK